MNVTGSALELRQRCPDSRADPMPFIVSQAAGRKGMTRYYFSLVENTYVVRQSRSKDGAEYFTPEGEWIDYPHLWDGTMNGRPIASVR